MRLKLDENLGTRCVDELRSHGHDATTVALQGMSGSDDCSLIAACRDERRCLVTLDMDFANPLRFDPRAYGGIVVIRLGRHPTHRELLMAVATLIRGLQKSDITGKLWIVQRDRVREYQPD